MAKGKNKDYVSFWFWMLALFVASVPCIGWIMIIIWALVGNNESRKNYFRALIVWTFIVFTIDAIIAASGFWVVMQKQVEMWSQRGNGGKH
jgi:hypothetical protein